MEIPKPYEFIGKQAMDSPKPKEIKGNQAMEMIIVVSQGPKT